MSAPQSARAGHAFDQENAAALTHAEAICRYLVGEGRKRGPEWVSGGLRVHLETGRWSDAETGFQGEDFVTLVSFFIECDLDGAAFWLRWVLWGDFNVRF